jgi:hypothetical protein
MDEARHLGVVDERLLASLTSGKSLGSRDTAVVGQQDVRDELDIDEGGLEHREDL